MMVDFIIAVSVEMKRSEWSQDIFVFGLTRLGGRLNMNDDQEGGVKNNPQVLATGWMLIPSVGMSEN